MSIMLGWKSSLTQFRTFSFLLLLNLGNNPALNIHNYVLFFSPVVTLKYHLG